MVDMLIWVRPADFSAEAFEISICSQATVGEVLSLITSAPERQGCVAAVCLVKPFSLYFVLANGYRLYSVLSTDTECIADYLDMNSAAKPLRFTIAPFPDMPQQLKEAFLSIAGIFDRLRKQGVGPDAVWDCLDRQGCADAYSLYAELSKYAK